MMSQERRKAGRDGRPAAYGPFLMAAVLALLLWLLGGCGFMASTPIGGAILAASGHAVAVSSSSGEPVKRPSYTVWNEDGSITRVTPTVGTDRGYTVWSPDGSVTQVTADP